MIYFNVLKIILIDRDIGNKTRNHCILVFPLHRRYQMKNWKSRQDKKRKSSSTPGKTKGESCRSSDEDRAIARSNRSYKWANYGAWVKRMDRKYNPQASRPGLAK